MSIAEIEEKKKNVDDIFNIYPTLPENEELQSHWAKYLTVMVSGLLQFSIKLIFSKYVEDNANKTVHNYVESKLDYFRNPRLSEIYKISKEFDEDWEKEIKARTPDETKSSLFSIVSNRNNIVHGGDSDITYSRIKQYYADAWKLIDVINSCCK